MADRAPWITHRPDLRVLDCTVRDGGLMNDHQFRLEFVRAVYQACLAAGIDYMEVGYKNSPELFPRSEFGPWRHSDEESIREAVGDHDSQATGLKLSVMADAGKSNWQTQIGPCADSVVDMVRVAFYEHQVPEAVEMIHHAHQMGYETMANLMAVSVVSEAEIDAVLEAIAGTPVGTMVIVDSYGHLYREQLALLYERYAGALADTKIELGIHAHNNQQLAFANTIEGIVLGATRADATIGGLGRGAGNCPMELLLGFLRNPKFHLRPVVEALQHQVEPLRESVNWGPSLPYHITGQLNRHPRAAMEWLAGTSADDSVSFFDKVYADR
jgi:4-hydroxy 2-oxovalerate aldolase